MRSITNVKISPAVTDAEKRRQHIVLGGGGVVIAILCGVLFWPQEQSATPAVELATAPPSPAAAAPVLAAPPAVATAAPQLSADVSRYILYGIGGGGAKGRAAIIGLPNGGQRVLPAGRTLTPGVTIKEVGPDYAILSTASGEMRLEFRKAAVAVADAASPAPNLAVAPPRGQAGPRNYAEQAVRYRLAMEPRERGGFITGYTIKNAAGIPSLMGAGLKTGDVLLSVNGETMDSEERLHGLAETFYSEPVARIAYERNGQRIETEIKVK